MAVRLGFLADTGIAGRADGLADGVEAVLGELARLDPDVVLGGGDYAYRSSDGRWRTPQQAVHGWLDQMAPLVRDRPFVPQYGNHEVSLGERYRDWAAHFPVPEPEHADIRSYSFELGPCHVVAFYAPTGDVDPAELSWLWADLAEARARRGDAWIVVFQHQPLVAHGSSHPAEPRVQRAMRALLQVHRVDLHLSAHDQNYERTFPVVWLDGRPTATSAAGHRYRRGEGTILAKVGPGGKRSDRGRAFSQLPACRHDVIAASDDTAHHFALIEASPERLVLNTYATSKGAPAAVIDRVEIVT